MKFPFRSKRMNLAYQIGRKREMNRALRWKEAAELQAELIEQQARTIQQLSIENNMLEFTLRYHEIDAPRTPADTTTFH